MLTLTVLLENAKEPDIAVFGNYVKLLNITYLIMVKTECQSLHWIMSLSVIVFQVTCGGIISSLNI